jgi:hypothetical protein
MIATPKIDGVNLCFDLLPIAQLVNERTAN